MEFTWDPVKNKMNKAKHGVSFETTILVFDDPYHLSKPDRVVDGEQRWKSIGEIHGMAILIVAHSFEEKNGEEMARIISARKATKKERKRYEEKY